MCRFFSTEPHVVIPDRQTAKTEFSVSSVTSCWFPTNWRIMRDRISGGRIEQEGTEVTEGVGMGWARFDWLEL